MKWQIPAKTFLLGEYSAIAEASAIILTTNPCFELSLADHKSITGIHPQSPAGLWWHYENCLSHELVWYDPYNGQGGLGASSAQFLATYLACCTLKNKPVDMNDMLSAYYQSAWSGTGLRPSGYDVIAQSQSGCVFINKQKHQVECYNWPFTDLSFFLIHTGIKLATHHHLQETPLPQVHDLSKIVDEAKNAFEQNNSQLLIKSINDYHQRLHHLNLVASHSLKLINQLKENPEILALKGCGALGADVLLIISTRNDSLYLKDKLMAQKWLVLATEANITTHKKQSLLKISV